MNMFRFKEPSVLGKPWVLSDYEEHKVAEIPSSTLTSLKNYHILAIEFLFQKYQDKSPGAILNEEHGFNMQLQVATFLNIVLNIIKQKFRVLLLCPNDLLSAWHYHLSIHGGLKVLVMDMETLPKNIKEHHTVHLVPFSGIKRVEDLIEDEYSVAIIDSFHQIASKRVVSRINSGFNIGLTDRSFYENPDQKLQWTMLNWCNPGCAGRLSDFYKIDNENLLNFRDNYRHWWFRLTWDFCDTFRKPTEDDIQAYNDDISQWAVSQKLIQHEVSNVVSNRTSKRQNISRRKGAKKLKRTKSEQVEPTDERNINTPSDESHRDSTVYNHLVKCTQNSTDTLVEGKEKSVGEKSNLDFSSDSRVNNENMQHILKSEKIKSPESTLTDCSSKSYTLSSNSRDHELFLSLLNPEGSEKRKISVSSEVEEILKEADELLS